MTKSQALDGQTVLHRAADQNRDGGKKKNPYVFNHFCKGRLEMVEYLLEKGADKNLLDENDHRPVDLAVDSGYYQVYIS